MIKVNKALIEDFCKHVTNIYGVTSSDKLRVNEVAVKELAIDYAIDYVDEQIDSYIVDDNSKNYIADKVVDILLLALKSKINYDEKKYGIYLF